MSRRGYKNRKKTGIVTLVLLLMLAIMSFNILKLYQKNQEYTSRQEELEKEVEREEERQEELQAYEEFTKTIEYVEQVAREKLGLVFENEIIFKSDDN